MLAQVFATEPDWLVVTRERKVLCVVRPPTANALGGNSGESGDGQSTAASDDRDVATASAFLGSLHDTPPLVIVPVHATMREVLHLLRESAAGLALVCEGNVAPGEGAVRPEQVRGVLERAALESESTQ